MLDGGIMAIAIFIGGMAFGILMGVLGIAITMGEAVRIEDLADPAPTSDWKDRGGDG